VIIKGGYYAGFEDGVRTEVTDEGVEEEDRTVEYAEVHKNYNNNAATQADSANFGKSMY